MYGGNIYATTIYSEMVSFGISVVNFVYGAYGGLVYGLQLYGAAFFNQTVLPEFWLKVPKPSLTSVISTSWPSAFGGAYFASHYFSGALGIGSTIKGIWNKSAKTVSNWIKIQK